MQSQTKPVTQEYYTTKGTSETSTLVSDQKLITYSLSVVVSGIKEKTIMKKQRDPAHQEGDNTDRRVASICAISIAGCQDLRNDSISTYDVKENKRRRRHSYHSNNRLICSSLSDTVVHFGFMDMKDVPNTGRRRSSSITTTTVCTRGILSVVSMLLAVLTLNSAAEVVADTTPTSSPVSSNHLQTPWLSRSQSSHHPRRQRQHQQNQQELKNRRSTLLSQLDTNSEISKNKLSMTNSNGTTSTSIQRMEEESSKAKIREEDDEESQQEISTSLAVPSTDKQNFTTPSLTTRQSSSSFMSSLSTFLLGVVKDIVSVERTKKLVLFATSFWLMKKIMEELSNALEEVLQETNESSLREEHDHYMFSRSIIDDITSINIPFFDETVSAADPDGKGHGAGKGNRRNEKKVNNNRSNNNNSNVKKRGNIHRKPRPLTGKHHLAREMLLKLHLAGLPLEAQVQQKILEQQRDKGNDGGDDKDGDDGDCNHSKMGETDGESKIRLLSVSRIKTAESVLRSLTKAEGHLLNSCLWVPPPPSISSFQSRRPLSNIIAKDQKEQSNSNIENGKEIQRHFQQTMVANAQRQWNDIGGLGDVKEALLDLIYPLTMVPMTGPTQHNKSTTTTTNSGNINYNNYYGNLLSHPPPGVLLYGPPGCGKTMLIKALASSARARFLCITPSTLLRKYVGETNLKIRALFSLARKLSPCILFVDEVDGLFRERSSGGSSSDEHEVSRDLKTEFMQLWDGMMMNNEQNDHNRILVVGATNRPFDVDGAFLRRMPRSYFVGLPDVKARYAILSQLLKGVPLHATEFNLESIARHVTQGYSPSDMKELLRVAALFPLREARAKAATTASAPSFEPSLSSMSLSAPMTLPPLRPLTTHDVLQAQRSVTPTPYSESYRQALTDFITSRRPSYPSSPSHGGSHPHYENHSSSFPSFLERPNDYDEEQPQKRHGENHKSSPEEEEEEEGNYDTNIGGDDEYHDFSSFDDDDDDDDTGATDSDGDGYLYR